MSASSRLKKQTNRKTQVLEEEKIFGQETHQPQTNLILIVSCTRASVLLA
jgi:hypothetical protein